MKKRTVKACCILLTLLLLLGSMTGCRKVRSHKKTITQIVNLVEKEDSEDGDIEESDDEYEDDDGSDSFVDHSDHSSGGTKNLISDSNGASSSGKRVTLEYMDAYLFSANPTFYWSQLATGQRVNLTLKDTAGKVVFDKKGLTGNSYVCEPKLTDGQKYRLFMTFTNADGSEKVVNNVGEGGKLFTCIAAKGNNDKKNYAFKNTIPMDVLNNYLDRAVTYCTCLGNISMYSGNYIDETIRFLLSVGAKYVQRAAGEWYPTLGSEAYYPGVKAKLAAAHSVDPDIVFEACIFEVASVQCNDIPIPAYVFEAFGMKPENRNFNVDNMTFPSGYGVNEWEKGYHVPDITRKEFQMFVYYRACSFIDLGFEALHLGQVLLTGKDDVNNAAWASVIEKIREYAKKHARRGYVLINAHNNKFIGPDGKMLCDMIVAPCRVHAAPGETRHEVSETNPQRCDIEAGYWGDTIYQSGISGISPCGWYAKNYPYLVEFDNYGGVLGDTSDPNSYVWGRDEIAWFAAQPDWYQREFMNFFVNKVRGFNENGHVSVIGNRGGGFLANNLSEYCPDGAGHEDLIRSLFSN